MDGMEAGNERCLKLIHPHSFVQHSPRIGEGVEGYREYMRAQRACGAHVRVVRAFEDGDYVFTHSLYECSSPRVGFDVYRFTGPRITAHWDNLQSLPPSPNPGGHTMLDGATDVADFDQTVFAKEIAEAFVQDVLVESRLERATAFFDGDQYIQHDPQTADGLSGPGATLQQLARKGPGFCYHRVHKVLGEGNFALVVSEGTIGVKTAAIYDLFRVEQGHIVEHWDTVEEIMGPGESRNSNGKFGF